MRVELGPVDSGSVRHFADYGQKVLDAPLGRALPEDVREAFVWQLTTWLSDAPSSGDVRWSFDAPCDEIKYFLHAFHRVAVEVESGLTGAGLPPFPRQAVPFYRTLVNALLETVAGEASCATWAEDLARFWPGLGPVERPVRSAASGVG